MKKLKLFMSMCLFVAALAMTGCPTPVEPEPEPAPGPAVDNTPIVKNVTEDLSAAGTDLATVAADATLEGAYYIASVDGLNNFATLVNGGKDFAGITVTLEADIDLNPMGLLDENYALKADLPFAPNAFTSIGECAIQDKAAHFKGTFDGKNHFVKGVYIVGEAASGKGYGFFGGTSGAAIKNFNLIDSVVSFKSSGNRLGLLVGCNGPESSPVASTIENCYVSGCVDGGDGAEYIGGLLGRDQGNDCEINYCVFVGAAGEYGICGKGEPKVLRCYVSGAEKIAPGEKIEQSAIDDVSIVTEKDDPFGGKYLTANTLIKRTVSFKYNFPEAADGLPEDYNEDVYDGDKVNKPSKPKYSGYMFKGWFVEGAESAFDFENTPITADTTLTVQWQQLDATIATVTFDVDHDDIETNDDYVTKGQPVSEPEAPKRVGYTFDGWYNGESKWTFTDNVTEDVTLKAKWTWNNVPEVKNVNSSAEGTDISTVNAGDELSGSYYIASVEGWNKFAELVTGGMSFAGITVNLECDIDMSPKGNILDDGNKLIDFSDKDYLPNDFTCASPDAYNTKKFFEGTFDGKNHTIKSMYINCEDAKGLKGVGLFGGIKGATISNLKVLDSYVVAPAKDDNSRFAILVGVVSEGTCLISNCEVKGFVQSYEYNGSIIGRVQSGETTVTSCTASCNVSAKCGKGTIIEN